MKREVRSFLFSLVGEWDKIISVIKLLLLGEAWGKIISVIKLLLLGEAWGKIISVIKLVLLGEAWGKIISVVNALITCLKHRVKSFQMCRLLLFVEALCYIYYTVVWAACRNVCCAHLMFVSPWILLCDDASLKVLVVTWSALLVGYFFIFI